MMKSAVSCSTQHLTQWFQAILGATLGHLRTSTGVWEKRAEAGKELKELWKSPQHPAAPNRRRCLELLLPTLPRSWLSPAFLSASPRLLWSVVFLFISGAVLCPKALLSALCSVFSTFSLSLGGNPPPPTFIYVMLRPKCLSPNKCS